jgi:hypothetical protein
MASGWHIVQWLGDEGWQVRVMELGPSQEATISVRTAEVPGVPEDPADVAQEKPPREARSKERGAVASVALGYQLALSKLTEQGQLYEGLQGGPALVLRARTTGSLHLRLGAELVPGASGARTGSPARAHLAVGWQQDQGPRLGLALGPVLGGASSLVPSVSGLAPSFEPGRAWGLGLVTQVQPLDALYLEVQGEWIDAGFGASVLAQMQLVELGSIPLLISVGGHHWQSAQAGRSSWVQVGLGSAFTF